MTVTVRFANGTVAGSRSSGQMAVSIGVVSTSVTLRDLQPRLKPNSSPWLTLRRLRARQASGDLPPRHHTAEVDDNLITGSKPACPFSQTSVSILTFGLKYVTDRIIGDWCMFGPTPNRDRVALIRNRDNGDTCNRHERESTARVRREDD
jgi:hypothetical protein